MPVIAELTSGGYVSIYSKMGVAGLALAFIGIYVLIKENKRNRDKN